MSMIARCAALALAVMAACAPRYVQRPLPKGLVVECFVAGQPCRETADLDRDGREDTIVLVARTEAGETKRGLVILWDDRRREPMVIGAGTKLAVVELGDEETAAAALAGARPSEMDDDLSYLEAWGVIHQLPAFLPRGRGPAIKLSGGDAAWVVYLSRGDDIYYAPLGY